MSHLGSHDETPVSDQWYADAFGALYPVIYAHRTVEAAIPEASFAREMVALDSRDTALDLCCGAGRHLATLHASGARLTGADYSIALLRLARKRLSLEIPLVRMDMRRLPFPSTFDVLFSFFTSFGYFFDEKDNLETALEMGRILKKNGRFFMDYLNPLILEKTLQPKSVRTSEGYEIHERRWIDHARSRVNKQVEIYREGMLIGKTGESVRLYTIEEMRAILGKAGLHVKKCWGDYSGTGYDRDSQRMILMGIKGDT